MVPRLTEPSSCPTCSIYLLILYAPVFLLFKIFIVRLCVVQLVLEKWKDFPWSVIVLIWRIISLLRGARCDEVCQCPCILPQLVPYSTLSPYNVLVVICTPSGIGVSLLQSVQIRDLFPRRLKELSCVNIHSSWIAPFWSVLWQVHNYYAWDCSCNCCGGSMDLYGFIDHQLVSRYHILNSGPDLMMRMSEQNTLATWQHLKPL